MSGSIEISARRRERWIERGFRGLGLAALALPLVLVLGLLGDVVGEGLARIDQAFLVELWPALVDSLALVALALALALPLGLGSALWLEEYGSRGRGLRAWLARVLASNVALLAGVPSVIGGVLGLGLFVGALGLASSLLVGALTLGLLLVPIVSASASEALRRVPAGVREAGLALGATRWRVTRGVVLPVALPELLSGALVAIARALGEAAALLVLGGLALDVLPVRIFAWLARPEPASADAAAGIVVLLALVFVLHGAALVLRGRARAR
ncbi:ABC transporter permease subunit [Nannocystaceae bacterium ST9]